MPLNIHFQYEATLKSAESQSKIRIWLAQPTNSRYQKINLFKINPEPNLIYRDEQGNEILYLKIKKTEKTKVTKIEFNINAVLFKDNQRKNAVISKSKPIGSSSLDRWRLDEKFLEQTKEIKKVAFKLTAKDKNDLEKVKTIFNFAVKNFHYQYPVKNRGTKNLNLNYLRGDCAEYSGLLVAMCRALKIPARNQTGFVIHAKKKTALEHGWASVYLKNYGWLDLDPQYASLEKNQDAAEKNFFLNRGDYRLNFVNGFNLPLKPKIPTGFDKNFWLDRGLLLTNNSAQTLQPLIFVSNKSIKLSEKIKIK